MKFTDTTVIVPTFNEGANIAKLLDVLLKLYPGIHVIVADDGSKDSTQEIVQGYHKKHPAIRLLDRSHERIHGLTISVVDAALLAETPFFIVIDGDMQHPPEKIKDLRERLADGAQVVVGRRDKVHVPWPWHRKLMSWTAIVFGRMRLLLSGAMTKDVMSGFFGARTELFKRLARPKQHRFEPKGYKVLFDFLKLLPRKTRVDEVPYDFGLRTAGESKIKMKHILLYARSLFK